MTVSLYLGCCYAEPPFVIVCLQNSPR